MNLRRFEYPPSPPLIDGGQSVQQQVIPDHPRPSPSPSSRHYSIGSFAVVAVVIAVAAVVAFAIYFLIQFISHHFLRVSSSVADEGSVLVADSASSVADVAEPRRRLVDSLPAFTLGSAANSGVKDRDCAICLARFGPNNRLRLLPICCHVFHAECVDAWLESNHTCPICRSSVLASDAEISKALRSALDGGGESFRVEVGSVSRRRASSDGAGDGRRSFSMGSFDYVVDDAVVVAVGRAPRATASSDKDEAARPPPDPPGPALAGEVASQRSWLRDYVDRLASASSSSRALSFRSSGRFFTGSSRRSEVVGIGDDGHGHPDVESNRIGEEITEMFRWLSNL